VHRPRARPPPPRAAANANGDAWQWQLAMVNSRRRMMVLSTLPIDDLMDSEQW